MALAFDDADFVQWFAGGGVGDGAMNFELGDEGDQVVGTVGAAILTIGLVLLAQ